MLIYHRKSSHPDSTSNKQIRARIRSPQESFSLTVFARGNFRVCGTHDRLMRLKLIRLFRIRRHRRAKTNHYEFQRADWFCFNKVSTQYREGNFTPLLRNVTQRLVAALYHSICLRNPIEHWLKNKTNQTQILTRHFLTPVNVIALPCFDYFSP